MLRIATIFLLTLSLNSFASTAAETITQIETAKDAKCTYKFSTNRYCFNSTCYNWKNYQCTPNSAAEEDFKIRLRLRSVLNQSSEVTNITYY